MSRLFSEIARRATTIAITAAITLALVGAGSAMAGSTGTINACVNASSGEMKIVGPSDSCKDHETALTWDQQGPAGPQGPAGVDGVNGTNGTNGTNGVSGYETNNATFTTSEAGYALTGANGAPTFTQARDCSQPGNCVLRVYCSPGKVALGGGYLIDDSNGGSVNVTGARTNTRGQQPGIFPVGDNYAVNFNTAGVANPAAGISVAVRCVSVGN